MTGRQSVVINGDLGGGKTTVSKLLSERLGVRRVSMGDVHRAMAEQRRMTTLELNQYAARDLTVDDHVDQVQKDLASSGEQLVVDSRLGWHFFPDAFKVYVIVDPAVAAERVIVRPSDAVEGYTSVEQARADLERRSDSERERWIGRYGVDKYLLRNYDVVFDSTRVGPEVACTLIADVIEGRLGVEIVREAPPLLLIDPARILPTRAYGRLEELAVPEGAGIRDIGELQNLEPVGLGFADKTFFVAGGSEDHARLSAALRGGLGVVPGRLVAERDEPIGDSTARRVLASISPTVITGWEALHSIALPAPGHPVG